MSKTSLKTISTLLFCFLFSHHLFAHNGKVAYAYPLGNITVDGDFSDWPKDAVKYMISTHLSDTKPKDDNDFSGFFQLGYRLENRSLYIAFTVTDDDFIEDTSQNVRWNTQDGLELSIDARHLVSDSGVASFMYSKKLRNTNNAFYDPFAKNATWNIMEVAIAIKVIHGSMSGASCSPTSLPWGNRSASISMFSTRMLMEVFRIRRGVKVALNT